MRGGLGLLLLLFGSVFDHSLQLGVGHFLLLFDRSLELLEAFWNLFVYLVDLFD